MILKQNNKTFPTSALYLLLFLNYNRMQQLVLPKLDVPRT